MSSMRQIVLDTETTGLDPKQGHRVIEIGCVEIRHRRVTDNTFHTYLQPEREVEQEAITVHGLTNEFLREQPRFGQIVTQFMEFVQGAELIIHNAAFDVGFLNHELRLLNQGWKPLEQYCAIVDTLQMARQRHPGQKNKLDALCKRYGVDNSNRKLHGALLDAQLLAEVYLALTGGQSSLLQEERNPTDPVVDHAICRVSAERAPLAVIVATAEEQAAHRRKLDALDKACKGPCLWRSHEVPPASCERL